MTTATASDTDIELTRDELADTMLRQLGTIGASAEQRHELNELLARDDSGGVDGIALLGKPSAPVPSFTVRSWGSNRNRTRFFCPTDRFFPARRVQSGRPILGGTLTLLTLDQHSRVLARTGDVLTLFGTDGQFPS